MAFSRVQRLLRRIPALRWCAYQHAQQVRQKQADACWAYRQSVLVTLGNSTLAWAGVERILDELIAWYQHRFTDLSREHPRGLSNKLEYLRRMQRDERLTEKTREWLRRTRIEAKRLGDDRHELIHGMLWHHRGASLEWTTQRVTYDGPYARLRSRTFHNSDLQRVSAEISTLIGDLAPRVWILIGQDRSKYPVREIDEALSELGLV